MIHELNYGKGRGGAGGIHSLYDAAVRGHRRVFKLLVFSRDYPALDALGISVFHSVAAFNNSGFDILGGLTNLIPYQTTSS
mgnify:CR=1 FL=1